MRYIRAEVSDWRPDRPDIRPALWLLPVLFAGLIILAIAAFAGTIANGDGSPFWSAIYVTSLRLLSGTQSQLSPIPVRLTAPRVLTCFPAQCRRHAAR
jgi:hypothetical protein